MVKEFSPIEISSELPTDIPQLQKSFVQSAQKYNMLLEEAQKMSVELEWLKRHIFGRRSEQIHDSAQLNLPGLLGEKNIAQQQPVIETRQVQVKTQNGHSRNPLPKHLPRERVVIEPEKASLTCSCGCQKEKIGEDVTEELDFKPASFFVREFVRPKYACRKCEMGVTMAALPFRPIEKGRPGPGLLAQVYISKYGDHLPLYRQEQIYKRSGVYIPKSTQVGWVRGGYELLMPIYEEMHKEILTSYCIQSDDTYVPVLVDDKKKITHRGFIWAYIGNQSDQVVFAYTEHRNKDGPKTFLSGYRGYLQADAYAGYNDCFGPGGMTEVGCWAHARRYFFEAQTTEPGLSKEMLEHIGALYGVETEDRDRSLSSEERCKLRKEKSAPLLAGIKEWLDAQKSRVLPKSPIGQAIEYALNQWQALNRYLEDGRLSIDNNACERAIRAVAIGRKNWMFAGSHEGAKRAALMYSLIGSCKLLHIDPFEYMRDVIDRISGHPANRITELTPAGWKKAQPIPPAES